MKYHVLQLYTIEHKHRYKTDILRSIFLYESETEETAA